MRWSEVRKDYPDCWVVVEALSSRIYDDEETIDEVTVVNSFEKSRDAYQDYLRMHKLDPQRDYLFASTVNEALKVKIQYWVGVRDKR